MATDPLNSTPPDSSKNPPRRLFLTGGSGCVGHYLLEQLLETTTHEIFVLIRTPEKLAAPLRNHPRVYLQQGSLTDIEQFADLLATMDLAILAAAAWGGAQDVMDINVNRNLQLLRMLDPDRCEQVIYFSTASILDQHNRPLAEAGAIGTDYIRSKYECHKHLPDLALYPKITTVFPTLVFGGDKDKPYSFISAGLSDITKWLWGIRFLKADGSFHFVHAQDIAQVVCYLLEHPSPTGYREYVLGNAPITANQAIREVCEYFDRRILFRMPLSFWLADVIIKVFRVEMAPWDYFCLKYRHFVYDAVNPASFGLTPYCETVADLFRVHGL